jgi:prepilin-type N-terminal cleavage/methylation domain-containing protein
VNQSHPFNRSARPTVGFTLVEMLVVVAILALLVSLLVPAVGRSRDQARLVQCRARLSQMGKALLLYAGRNNGQLPVAKVLHNPHDDLLAALVGGKYIQTPQSYYCPSLENPDLAYSPENFQRAHIGLFYYSAREVSRDGSISTFLRWDVTWPRELNVSMHPETWVMSDPYFRGEPTAHRYYGKGVNYLMLGGSVDFVSESPRKAFR